MNNPEIDRKKLELMTDAELKEIHFEEVIYEPKTEPTSGKLYAGKLN